MPTGVLSRVDPWSDQEGENVLKTVCSGVRSVCFLCVLCAFSVRSVCALFSCVFPVRSVCSSCTVQKTPDIVEFTSVTIIYLLCLFYILLILRSSESTVKAFTRS